MIKLWIAPKRRECSMTGNNMNPDEPALRRIALQLASQLPEGRDNCVSVVHYVLELVTFMYGGGDTAKSDSQLSSRDVPSHPQA